MIPLPISRVPPFSVFFYTVVCPYSDQALVDELLDYSLCCPTPMSFPAEDTTPGDQAFGLPDSWLSTDAKYSYGVPSDVGPLDSLSLIYRPLIRPSESAPYQRLKFHAGRCLFHVYAIMLLFGSVQ